MNFIIMASLALTFLVALGAANGINPALQEKRSIMIKDNSHLNIF